jgi:hypothetical protein
MGFSEKEIGRMSFRKWKLLYEAYQLVFDMESTLIRNGRQYADLNREITIDDVIPF